MQRFRTLVLQRTLYAVRAFTTSLPLTTVAVLATLWGAACGSSDTESSTPADGGAETGGGTGGTGTADAAWPDGSSTADAQPTTTAYDPCATEACWTAPTLGVCGSTKINEDYGSGLYGVHHYLVMAPADVDFEISVTRTAGNWQPALILHDEQGTTVYDGTQAHSTAALEVTALAAPPDTDGVRIRPSKRMHLGLYMTGDSVIANGFTGAVLPQDAEYTLQASAGCAPPAALSVRGVKLSARQELWVRYIAEHVVPKLPGTKDERIDKGAYVAWWALKEGVLDTNNPLAYSNCSIPPDKHIGPVEVCPNAKNAWQVGISGVQATYTSVAAAEQLAQTEYPQLSLTEVLANAASTAGYGVQTTLGQTIITSSDRLRLSWLIRNGPVGFAAQYSPVYNQCFVSTQSWCFGSGWPSSASFAPTQAGAKQAVTDLKSIFQSLVP